MLENNNRFEIIYKKAYPQNISKKFIIEEFQIIYDNQTKKHYLHIHAKNNFKIATILEARLTVKTNEQIRKYKIIEKVPPRSSCYEDEIIDISDIKIRKHDEFKIELKPTKLKANMALAAILIIIAAMLSYLMFSQIQQSLTDRISQKANEKRVIMVNTTPSSLNVTTSPTLYTD